MKLLIVLTIVALCHAHFETYEDFQASNSYESVSDYANTLGFKTFDQQFLKFKLDHSKSYATAEEESKKKFNFLRTLQKISKHSELYAKGEATHEIGVGPFADLTTEEYHSMFSMPRPDSHNSSLPHKDIPVVFDNLPGSFDWRQSGKVTPVKNQGQCGSCWSFTTNAIIESGYLIFHNQLAYLSEQQLVDCLNTNCGGYYIDRALDYVRQHGVEQQSAYPYTARAGQCREDNRQWKARISGVYQMGRGINNQVASAAQIMTAVRNHGPVGLMFDAQGDDFAHYRGGILTTGLNQWKAVHAVTIVGWGSENGHDYWIIKNSWGTGWGEGGFFRMTRGRDLRGCEEWLYYATF